MANEGSTKPTYSELEAEVAGLRSRIDERCEVINEIGRVVKPAHGQALKRRIYELTKAESELACVRGLLRRANSLLSLSAYIGTGGTWRDDRDKWLADVQSTFPLVPQGAESADIGKLDRVDKSGPRCIPCLAGAHHNRFTECGYSEYRVCQKCGTAWLPNTVEQCPKCSASAIDERFKGMATDEKYQAVTKSLAGSAETGGEKAAQWQPIDSAPKTGEHILVMDEGCTFGLCGGKMQPWYAIVHYWGHPGEEGFYLTHGDHGNSIYFTHWQPIDPPTFPRGSQNQTVSGGVEGAHEGTTADESELLPTQLPKEK